MAIMGNRFKRGIDCWANNYSPTISATACRTFLAACCCLEYAIHSFDVKTAYLTSLSAGSYYCFFPNVFKLAELTAEQVAELHKKMTQGKPEEIRELKKLWCAKFDKHDSRRLLTIRAIYGDPSSGKSYYLHMREVLKSIGWQPSRTEACLFTRKMPCGAIAYLICFVDDCAFGAPAKYMTQIAQEVQKVMEITVQEGIKSFLGCHIDYQQARGVLTITVPGMLENLHERFKQYFKRPTSKRRIPLPAGTQLKNATDEEYKEAANLPYQSVIGCLVWIVTWVKVEAACAVSMLGSHHSKWNKQHFDHAIEVLQFLIQTKHYGLKYTRPKHLKKDRIICAYADSDLAGCVNTRKSRTGFIVIMAGAMVSKRSALQKTIVLSTCAAEIVALNELADELNYVRQILEDMGLKQNTITCYEDNKCCLEVANQNRGTAQVAKYMQMRELRLQEMVDNRIITVVYCKTVAQIADIFTKCLGPVIFERLWKVATGYQPASTLLDID